MLKLSELRAKSKEELTKELGKIKDEMVEKKQDLLNGKNKKSAVLSFMKKDIARISTVLREKEILEGL